MSIICNGCNAFHWLGERLSRSSQRKPEFGMCCNRGLIEIKLEDPPPNELQQLFLGEDTLSRNFRSSIRQYNAALAFTSLGVDIVDSVNRDSRGPYVFKIAGELCHRSGGLLPLDGEQPSYAQLYIYDPQQALNNRMSRNNNLSEEIMHKLQTMLAEHHHYAHVYRHAHQILMTLNSHNENDLSLRLCADVRNRHQYNLPSSDEIAVIIPGDGTATTDSRDIILTLHTGVLQRINDAHPAYACLHYVLLFP
ncbi:hypothetical protein BGW80DRAFT_1184546, partial [Lactifluus volemus]